MPPRHQYDADTTPTLADYYRQCEQEHADQERGTCLGAGCCDWCGRPWDRCECEDDDVSDI